MKGISIVMPFRNAAATLTDTLHTILAQTWTAFELIAVDDGSNDDSVHVLHQIVGDDSRLRFFPNPGKGLVDALNAGIEAASFPWIARMDADDRMHPQRLELQAAAVGAQPDLDLVAGQVSLFPQSLIQDGYREYIRWQNACLSPEDINNQIYVESPFAHPSVMLRREAVQRLGGYRDGDFPEDYELWLRMAHAGCRMAKVPHVVLDWRERGDRTSRTDPRYAREAFDRIRARYLAADPRLATERPLAIWGAGRRTRRRADHLLEQGFAPVAWIDIDPRKVGRDLHGVPIVAPDWLASRDPRPFVLSYVANHGARDLITARLENMGYRVGADYLVVG